MTVLRCLRIVVVGNLNPDDFADNVRDSLERMGHEVVAIGAARPRYRRLWARNLSLILSDRVGSLDTLQQRHLGPLVRSLRPDLLLTVDRTLHPSAIDAAKSAGARVALWFPDHVGNMDRHQLFLAGYDRIYMKNPVLVERLHGIYGLPVSYLPEAANSGWHSSTAEYGTRPVVVVAGNIHPTRAILLERLLRAGVPLEIYGGSMPRWLHSQSIASVHTGQYLARQDKANAFRSARAVLNNLHPAEFAGVNCRAFEATASGAVLLTESREGLEDLFEPSKEVLTFASFDQLTHEIEMLLTSQSYGRPIAEAAAQRAHRDHIYEIRLERILEDVLS